MLPVLEINHTSMPKEETFVIIVKLKDMKSFRVPSNIITGLILSTENQQKNHFFVPMTMLHEAKKTGEDKSITALIWEAALAIKKTINTGIVKMLLATTRIKITRWINVND